MASQPDPYAATYPKPGKPIVKSYPTPDLTNRIFVVRKDSRAGGYVLPAHGDKYDGPEPQKMEGFVFATAVPSDQTGWVDWYYLDERENEDAYNALVTYPYADKDYPQVTRTYTRLRTEAFPNTVVDEELSDDPSLPDEPEADSVDPVYPELLLVDHKVVRFDDPILDSIFVNVQRVYERLPSPIIRSYEQSGVKQIVTIDTQEVVASDLPVSSATTEVLKVERTTTAKCKVTTGTVPDVFPADAHSIERPDLMPPEFKGLIPTVTEALDLPGDAVLPTLGVGELARSSVQKDEFVKRDSVTKRAAVTLPKTLIDKDIEHLSQGRFGEGFASAGTIEKTVNVGDQALEVGKFITDSEVHLLGDGNSEKIVHKVVDWPILHQRTVDEQEGYAINVEKKVIDPLDAAYGPHAPAGQYVDVMPYDRWRSIQITSKIDLTTLPPEETYATFIDMHLPPTLLEVIGNYTETGGSGQEVDDRFKDDTGNIGIAKVSVAAGAIGSVGVLGKHGFQGKAFGTVTRHWFAAPPSKAQLVALGAVVTKILPAAGSVTMVSKHVSFTQGRGLNYSEDSNSGEMKTETVDIAGYLTGGLDGLGFKVTNGTYNSAPSIASGTTIDGYQASLWLPGPQVNMLVHMPLSEPGWFASGTEIVVDVQTTKRRFGLWLVEIFKAIVP